MAESYKKKYFYLYFFRTLSFGLGLASLFVVIPHISSNKELYGIYSLCLSLVVYFSYADLGFTGAAQKFAAEAYIQKDKAQEQRIVGFIAILILTFMALVALVLLLFSIYPEKVINGLQNGESKDIAKQLLLIIVSSFPLYATNRILDIIYSIRLEDYKYQGCVILGNIIRIVSVFYFFSSGRYLIVEYFFFCQVIMAICCVIGGLYAYIRYDYGVFFIKSMKFEKTVFDKLKYMAFASLIGMISWILYYELDQIVIAKLWGAQTVAIYAIGFAITSYIRTYNSILYSPFTPRMNYFVGNRDQKGLDHFTKNLMIYLFPIQFFPIVVMICFALPFITHWTGIQYLESVPIAQILALSFAFLFITNPAGVYIQAMEKNSKTIVSSLINVVVFWVGIFVGWQILGVIIFPVMKVITIFVGFLYMCYIMNSISEIRMKEVVLSIIRHYCLPLLLCVLLSSIASGLVLHTNLLIVLLSMGISLFISLGVAYYSTQATRTQIRALIKSAKNHIA